MGDGPFNIVLEPIHFRDYVAADTPVEIDGGRIRVGSLEIALASAQIWEPRFHWEFFQGRDDSLSNAVDLLEAVLVEMAPVESFVQLIHPQENAVREIEARILIAAKDPARGLLEGLLRLDEGLGRMSAGKLTGLGAGLTPDGDDVMMGGILALWALWAGKGVKEAAGWVSLEASPRTTPVAAAWLQASSRGECSVRWHDLLQAILLENENNILDAVRTIIQQGHTSGASALSGFTAALMNTHQE